MTLRFAFPEGLSSEDEQDLLSQLAILWRQPWSPRRAVEAVLRDWPESEPERTITLEVAEQALLEECLEAEKKIQG